MLVMRVEKKETEAKVPPTDHPLWFPHPFWHTCHKGSTGSNLRGSIVERAFTGFDLSEDRRDGRGRREGG